MNRQRSTSDWKRARATCGVIAFTVVWYLGVQGSYGLSTYGLVAAGAMDTPDILAGQWFRLISAVFVHVSVLHLAVNMVSLASLWPIERLIGWKWYVFTYFASGLVGDVAAFAIGDKHAVYAGASGAIFGIFAVALILAFRGILTKSARNQLLVVLALNLVYGFATAGVSNTAHIGGLLTGSVCTWVFLQRRVSNRVQTALCSVAIVLSAISLYQALHSVSGAVMPYS